MKKIWIAILALSFLFGVTGCGKKKEEVKEKPEEPGIHANTNEGIVKEQQIGGLRLTNTALVITDGRSQLTTSVINETDEDILVEDFDIIVKNADGNVITTLKGYVGGVVPKQQTREIFSNCNIDLSNAADLEYKLNQ